MKIKISVLYGIIGGSISFILASLVSSYFFLFTADFVHNYIVKKSPWPLWAVILELLVTLLVFIAFFISGIKFSISLGQRQEADFKETFFQYFLLIFLSIIAVSYLMIPIYFFFLKKSWLHLN